MFRSATVKLTLWYIGLVVAISLVFSIVLYQVGSNQLINGMTQQAGRIYNQFPVFQGDPILHSQAGISAGEHNILLRLIAFNIIVIIAAGFGSYALARRTLKPIEEAHEQQKRFTADVSHELRTPLTALKMESEVALMSPKVTAAELRSTLESNLEEANKLEGLINNLLRLTRLEAEEIHQQFVSISSILLADHAIEAVNKVAEHHSVTIDHQVKDFILKGDEASLVQLLVTLLDNAIKYSPKGSTVTLYAEQKDNQAIFQIIDHGIGIESESLKHVFDRFYRADDSRTKTTSGGFGLGLSIAKMIADVHDGTITISSRVGKGTKVTVSFPLAG